MPRSRCQVRAHTEKIRQRRRKRGRGSPPPRLGVGDVGSGGGCGADRVLRHRRVRSRSGRDRIGICRRCPYCGGSEGCRHQGEWTIRVIPWRPARGERRHVWNLSGGDMNRRIAIQRPNGRDQGRGLHRLMPEWVTDVMRTFAPGPLGNAPVPAPAVRPPLQPHIDTSATGHALVESTR